MKSTALFLVLAAIIGVSIFLTYDRMVVQKDFETFNSEEELTEEEDEATNETEEVSQEEEAADEFSVETEGTVDLTTTESGS